ncbi:MAG TPA: adenylosuccinate synthase [Actinomycetota bacterium]|nr:adenylosuccinate synthase [Actinomycetota bacterium]
MPATIVLGTQWGDEGKGKAVDYLADGMDLVVRYQGGNNAGHTVIAEGRLLKLQLIPSGVLYPHITPVIADGVVVDPRHLLRELDEVRRTGVDVSRLRVSGNCHLIMPYHLELEKVTQRFLGRNALGTTKRGIGPAYADKAARIGLRVQDLFDERIFREKLEIVLKEKNAILTKLYGRLPLEGEAIVDEYLELAGELHPYVGDTTAILHDALDAGRHLMLEGAQGTMLDLDKGTYPFVTSSNPVAGYALASAGIGPKHVDRVVGIVKAYVTRVGSGPFPTEELGEEGERLGLRGQEFGTVTGRKRRCGWFDAVVARYAARVNGLTELFVTKVDVLSGFERLRICTGYRVDGQTYDELPPHQSLFHRAEPVYERVDGWMEEIDGARSFEDLPKAARGYVRRLEELVGVPVSVVSVGPAREQSLPVG